VAVTPTFPSRETLTRLRFRPLDVAVGLLVLLLIYAAVRVGEGARAPVHASTTIDLSPSNLPYYAGRSLIRMFIALAFSYAFSLGYAYVAARNRRARRVMVPALDILQSVPVLGFLAVTVTSPRCSPVPSSASSALRSLRFLPRRHGISRFPSTTRSSASPPTSTRPAG
jgi:NitT/TauT family transport system permease protein